MKGEVVIIAKNYVMQIPRAGERRAKAAARSRGIVVELCSSPAVDSGKLRDLVLQLGPCGEVGTPYIWATLRVDVRTFNTLLGVSVDRERFEVTEEARPCMAAVIADKHRDDFGVRRSRKWCLLASVLSSCFNAPVLHPIRHPSK
jgi:hypothetical protein